MAAYTAHLLEDGEDPDSLDSEKRTAVAYAAMHDHIDVLRTLLDFKCSISLADHEGLAPIHFAAMGDHAEVLQCLLDAGADPMTPKSAQNQPCYPSMSSTIGKVPLHYACELGNKAAVSKLLSCLDPSSRRSILPHWAAATGQAKVLSHILQYPEILANINKKNDSGNTPLFLAARVEDSATTRVLLDHGADVTARSDDIIQSPYHDEPTTADGKKGQTALQGWASYGHNYDDSYVRNHEEWVKVGAQLLEAGSDPEARNQKGETVMFAWRDQFVDRTDKSPDRAAIFISLLLKHGANPCAVSNSGNTVLHEPCKWNAKKKTIALLTQAGADINKARPGDLITPIISAAINQSVDIANSYGENLADFNAQDADGNTALHWISKSWLLEKNHIKDWLKFADPSIKNNRGETCLYNMRYGNDGRGRIDSIPLLIEKGLDLESRNRRGRTALLAACQNGESKFIIGLLKYGADARSRDFQGKSCK
jgi:ankyrin repeat protein